MEQFLIVGRRYLWKAKKHIVEDKKFIASLSAVRVKFKKLSPSSQKSASKQKNSYI